MKTKAAASLRDDALEVFHSASESEAPAAFLGVLLSHTGAEAGTLILAYEQDELLAVTRRLGRSTEDAGEFGPESRTPGWWSTTQVPLSWCSTVDASPNGADDGAAGTAAEAFPSCFALSRGREAFGRVLLSSPIESKSTERALTATLHEFAPLLYAIRRQYPRRSRTESAPITESMGSMFAPADVLVGEANFEGHFTSLNSAWEQTLGYTKEELFARPYLDFVHPDDLESTIATAKRLGEGVPAVDFTNRYRCRDGSYRWLNWHSVARAREGRVLFVTVDRTEEVHARELFENTQKAARIGGWELDCVTNKLTWTRETHLIHEVDPSTHQPELESAIDFYSPEAKPVLTEAIDKAMKLGTSWDLELQLVTAKRRRIWVRATGSVESVDGRAIRLYGSFQDIDAWKRAQEELRRSKEAAEQALLVKSRFISTMSHEIRTPMNGVIGLAWLLESCGLSGEALEYSQNIRTSAEALMRVIDDILDFSKIETEKLVLADEPFEIAPMIRECMEAFAGVASEKGIVLSYELGDGVPERVRGDERRVRQILIHLLGNGVKFTDEGEVRLNVRRCPFVSVKTRLAFEVTDTGIGMTEDIREHLFEPFTQADGSMTRRHDGTGLGLAISKRLAEMMGGTITVTSEFGIGTCVRFDPVFLECPPGGASLPTSTREEPARPIQSFGARVLVAEDNRTNQMVICRMLSRMGCEYDVVENGVLAVRALEDEHYDVVLMDCQMPEMDGLEATRTIRSRRGPHDAIPIIAVTANVRPEDRRACLAAGMDDHLPKPLRVDSLAAMLGRYIEPRVA